MTDENWVTEMKDPKAQNEVKTSKDFRPSTALDWDGVSDPENPHNWPRWKQTYHISVPALLGFISSYGISSYSPGIEGVSKEFHVSREVAVLPLSLYVLGLGVGPLVAGGISETFGRRVVYLTCMPLCLLFTLGAGFAQSIGSLLVCRTLAATAGAAPLAIGAGTIADMFAPHRRAFGIALWVLAPFLGPALGPSTTGYAAQLKNWRWTQWIMLFAGVPIYLMCLFQQETYKKMILKRRARKYKLPPPHDPIPEGWARAKFLLNVTCLRAMRMLVTEPIVAFFSIYTAFTFAVLFGFFASFPYVFGHVYAFNTGEAGLVFLSLGVGCILATYAYVEIDRRTYTKQAIQRLSDGNDQPIPPEERLYPAMVGCFLVPIGLFWFAWTARSSVHWIVPTLALIPFGCGNLMVFDTALMYLTDVYGPLGGASASAANAFLRYVAGAAFPLFSVQMFKSTGMTIPWAASFLGFVSIVLIPVPWTFYKYGPALRARSSFETNKA